VCQQAPRRDPGWALRCSGGHDFVARFADRDPHRQPVKNAAFQQGLVAGFVPWAEIRKIETSSEYLTFWQNGRTRFIIPRHAFQTLAEAEIFSQAANWWHSAATA
jgi:hypothetical protein